MGWLKYQNNIFEQAQFLCPMAGGLIHLHDDNTVCKLCGGKVKKYLKTVCIKMTKLIEKAFINTMLPETAIGLSL